MVMIGQITFSRRLLPTSNVEEEEDEVAEGVMSDADSLLILNSSTEPENSVKYNNVI